MSEDTSQKMSFFDKVWETGKEAIKNLQKPLVRRELRGRYEAAYLSCDKEIDACNNKLLESKSDLSKFDPKDIINYSETIERLQKAKKAIADDYLDMFGESIRE